MTQELMVNGQRYSVTETGTGSPLLMLHGFTGSSESWQQHVPVLAQTYQVITVDILGHGRSGSPEDPDRYQMAKIAADLTMIIALMTVAPVTLLGYSMGGRLALYMALAYPRMVRRLVLESASPGLATSAEREARRQQDEVLADWIEDNGLEAFVQRWEELPLWNSQTQLTPQVRAALQQQRLQNNPMGLANSLRGMGTGAQPSLWGILSTLRQSTLLITGELDSKFMAINQKMAAQIPIVQMEVVSGAGHAVHLERPSVFQQLVLNSSRERKKPDVRQNMPVNMMFCARGELVCAH